MALPVRDAPRHRDPVDPVDSPAIIVRERRVVTVLVVLALAVTVLGIVTQYLWLDAASGGVGLISRPLARAFDIDGEGSVPAWFGAMLLSASGALFWIAAGTSREPRRVSAWRALSLLFVLLSCDEVASLHETFGFWLAPRIGAEYFNVYTWLLAGIPFVAALGLALRGFLRALPPATRAGMFLAAGLYLGGAIGVELVEAVIDEATHGTLLFTLVASVEEFLEMAGLIVLIGTLLRHLRIAPAIQVRIRP